MSSVPHELQGQNLKTLLLIINAVILSALNMQAGSMAGLSWIAALPAACIRASAPAWRHSQLTFNNVQMAAPWVSSQCSTLVQSPEQEAMHVLQVLGVRASESRLTSAGRLTERQSTFRR